MYKSGQIKDNYEGGFREFDDRPPKMKAALNAFWSGDNPSNIDSSTLKLIVTLYRDTNEQRFF